MPDLPSEPSLTQLRHQARDLQRAVRRRAPDALAEVAERHPAGRPDDAAAASFPLSAAQLVVARRYDFPSWPRLRRYVEVVERYSRFPDRMAARGPEDPADEFLQLGCLYYDDDQPERWAQARQVLLAHPEITQVSVYAAAAAADVPQLQAHLGLGQGDGGPWKARMGDALDTPEQMVRGQLHWAVTHGMAERVRLLVEHGVDIVSPFGGDELTPAQRAATTGHPELVRYLVEQGAPAPDLRPDERFVAAALTADRATVAELRAAHPGLADAVREARPALIVWAAAQGQPGSVELLAGLGFDVNARGRSDVPAADPWQTAL